MTSEIDSFAVESGDPIVGIGALLVDDGSIRLTPNAPDERAATLSAVTIPVTGRNSVMPSGGWVSLSGTLLDGAIEADVIDGIDRPEYPGGTRTAHSWSGRGRLDQPCRPGGCRAERVGSS